MTSSRVARSLFVASACSAAALLASGTAHAEVVDLDILPGLSFGPTTQYGVGCTYVAVARTADPSGPRVDIASLDTESIMPLEEFAWQFDGYWSSPVIAGHKVSLWTPTTPGEHSLMAYETSAGGPVATVTVNPATAVGPLCFVAP
ncbi:hypothetical protein HQ308_18370 [Rhodococcus sp. BP-241]|uniref:hypothetical protein n=1 Tax=Rhodococcus sp. BP-241 TaxID=2739441 RepID=UPI001C9B2B29|nr:hypothetical protein [Rhodococcus sp. BP-241]MBY6708763.1 hypothetical protein [Rhodococcus sp. BP-241]